MKAFRMISGIIITISSIYFCGTFFIGARGHILFLLIGLPILFIGICLASNISKFRLYLSKILTIAGLITVFISIGLFSYFSGHDGYGYNENRSAILLFVAIFMSISGIIQLVGEVSEKRSKSRAFLTKCTLCDHDLSSEAEKCPHCWQKQ